MVKNVSSLPRTVQDTARSQLNLSSMSCISLYKSALLLKPIEIPSQPFIIFNFFLLTSQFYFFGLLLSFKSSSLVVLPLTFLVYFAMTYFAFVLLLALFFQWYLSISTSVLSISSLMSFSLVHLPFLLFISVLTGPLSFIFQLVSAFIINYISMTNASKLRTSSASDSEDFQRQQFIFGLMTIIAAFSVSYMSFYVFSHGLSSAIIGLEKE